MSVFENIEPKDIQIWFDEFNQRITLKATIDGKWHELALRKGYRGTLEDVIEKLKVDLRVAPLKDK